MSNAAGKDMHPLFDSFVKQSGIPYVSATLSCAPNQPPKLQLAQARYAPTGSQMAAGDRARTWTIPMCVKWGTGAWAGPVGRDCTVLDQPTGELALSAKSCPAWVLPNESELAYYVPKLAGADPSHLLAHAHDLTVAERVGLVADVGALVQAGDANNAVALDLVSDLAKDQSRHIVGASIGIVAGIDDMVPDELRPNYERLIQQAVQDARARARLGGQARRGRRPQAAAADAARPGRRLGQGPGADRRGDEAGVEVVRRPRRDPAGGRVDGAARGGEVRQPGAVRPDPRRRQGGEGQGEQEPLVSALGAFEDPKLLDQKLGIVLGDEFDIRESFGLVFAGLSTPKLRAATFAWVKQHFDDVSAKLPKEYRPFMAFVAAPVCDDKLKPEVEAFLKPKIEPLDGGPRILAQALEELSLCAARKAAQTPGVVAFLKKQ